MSGKIIKNSRNTEKAPLNAFSTQSVAFSHYNNISAQLPVNPVTGEIISADIKEQAKQCLDNIKAIVESVGHIMSDVVKINIYAINITELAAIDEVYATFFQGYPPVRTSLAVEALPMQGARVQMDALISNGEGTHPQAPCDLVKVAGNTPNAPQSPFSTQTVAFSHYNNIGAQLPIDPTTGNKVMGGIKQQTKQCLKNIKAILESIDVPFDDIVKLGIFVRNAADVDAVNDVFKTFFPDSAIARAVGYVPARSVVITSGLPMDALVQIDAVVSHGDGTPPQAVEDRHGIVIKARNTNDAPTSSLYTQTVAFSHYNHITAQLPLDPTTGNMVDGGVEEQTQQCLQNIKVIVESIGHEMDDAVKINIQLTKIADIEAVDDVYKTFFNGDLPARTVLGVADIPEGALVQIDAVLSNAEGTPPQA
ncbi:RidA family protein [uncultured Endozoicomonas sp.]|uniref:RidA family protein n=1 Tax=uncultured Endozoicomonas sp. TaxID=432652 RepID=UPI002619BC35|nr:RidA family protein [uncultured Endozoicomonas sp.]